MAMAASAPVLPNQKKQCCKIARFTDAPFIIGYFINFCTLHVSVTLCLTELYFGEIPQIGKMSSPLKDPLN